MFILCSSCEIEDSGIMRISSTFYFSPGRAILQRKEYKAANRPSCFCKHDTGTPIRRVKMQIA